LFDSLKLEQKQVDVQDDIWAAIDHGIVFFNIHQERKDTPHDIPPFSRTLQHREILLNDAFAAQSKSGWVNFLKGRITQNGANSSAQKEHRTCEKLSNAQ
jgi:hypothetical protein